MRLFVHQARLVDPGFVLADDNVADVVALCRRLDGLPLAVQLAAARVRLLPPRALLDHLDEALGLPLPGQPERQRTLLATVDWSYRMVGEPEQRAFRALAVFGGAGGTFDALAAVLDVPSSLAVVSGLLDAALVRVDDDPAGTRVRLLQTIRTVAADLAGRAGEADGSAGRHAQHYLAIAERAGRAAGGPDAIAARRLIEQEMDNLRAALDWSLGEPRHDDDEPTAHRRRGSGRDRHPAVHRAGLVLVPHRLRRREPQVARAREPRGGRTPGPTAGPAPPLVRAPTPAARRLRERQGRAGQVAPAVAARG